MSFLLKTKDYKRKIKKRVSGSISKGSSKEKRCLFNDVSFIYPLGEREVRNGNLTVGTMGLCVFTWSPEETPGKSKFSGIKCEDRNMISCKK